MERSREELLKTLKGSVGVLKGLGVAMPVIGGALGYFVMGDVGSIIFTSLLAGVGIILVGNTLDFVLKIFQSYEEQIKKLQSEVICLNAANESLIASAD